MKINGKTSKIQQIDGQTVFVSGKIKIGITRELSVWRE